MSKFSKIGLMGKPNNPEVKSTFQTLIDFLADMKLKVFLDEACAFLGDTSSLTVLKASEMVTKVDVVIVVGGDGSMLSAARTVLEANVPIIGVNRGHKGFLTDISPQAIAQGLRPMLKGEVVVEKRFLLEAALTRQDTVISVNPALNDVVLYSGHVARMVELEALVDGAYVYKMRSDGIILATPTGSTAYSLSAGGPIVHPSLEAISMVPMHPHTLTTRPIALPASSDIELKVTSDNQLSPRLSWDGQIHADVNQGDIIKVRRHKKELKLLHPKDYDYFQTLRGKLAWHIQ